MSTGVTLTVEPGVVVKFGDNLGMQVDGTLIARGTASQPITFTSSRITPTAGAWGFIKLTDSSPDATFDGSGSYTGGSILQYAVMEYAGSTGSGAVWLESAAPFIDHSTIRNNNKSGIYANSSSGLRISNNTISGNTALSGGIYTYGGTVTISGNTIISNTASYYSGGIYTDYGTVAISGNTISGNTGYYGGGISTPGGTVTILGNTIANNSASSSGGGIYTGYGTATISGNTISGNIGYYGGGIFTEGGTKTISGNTISGNTGYYGGGIFTEGGTVTISGNKIADNRAGNRVGIYAAGTSTIITNNSIVRNIIAGSGYASVYLYRSSFSCNTVVSNTAATWAGVGISDNPATFGNNNLYGNTSYEAYNLSSSAISATSNWWGTTDSVAIESEIYDFFDDIAKGIVSYSPYLSAPATCAPPSPPTGLSATPRTSALALSWNANPEGDVAGYRVYWDTDSGFPYANVITVGNTTAYTLTSLTNGIIYYVAVTAYDTTGDESWYSGEVSALPATPTPGAITGRVYEVNGSTPISGASIRTELYDLWMVPQGSATSQGDGSYTITGLASGVYRVTATAPNHAREFYRETPDHGAATPVTVTASLTTGGIDFTLAPGGTVTGTIHNADGSAPLANMHVEAYDASNKQGRGGACSGADGTYRIDNVAYGTYKVGSVERSKCGGDSRYLAEYYNNKPNWDSADTVVVTSGVNPTGIDFTLELGGLITGVVTGSGPIANLPMQAVDFNTGLKTAGKTQADGTYTLTLPTGVYKVGTCSSCAGLPYVDEWYDNVYFSNYATPVTVTAPYVTPNINFSLEVGGRITGVVTGSGPIANLHVNAHNFNTSLWTAGTNTSASGAYTLTVPTGVYRVGACASCSGLPYMDEWYDNVFNSNYATLITVTAPYATPNINFALEVGGAVAGFVYEVDSTTPISGTRVSVSVYGGGGPSGYAYSDINGHYRVQGLPSRNDYEVSAFAAGYAKEYYYETWDWHSLTRVSVTAPYTTTGIDFTLEPGGTISGRTYNSDGSAPLSGIHVSTSLADGPEVAMDWRGTSDEDGYYTIVGLPYGRYKVWACHSSQCFDTPQFREEYYREKTTWASADVITVASGVNPTGINFTLERAGAISGVVTYTGAITGTHNIMIVAYRDIRSSGWQWTATASPGGPYTILDVPSGTNYVTAFLDANDNLDADPGEPLASFANPISVSSGATTPNINITLDDTPMGLMAGTVDLQGRSDENGASVVLSSPILTATSVSDGFFFFIAPAGRHDITATMAGYLPVSWQGAMVTTDIITVTVVPTQTLLGGDADNDGDIDIFDLVLVGANFGQSVPPADTRADINGDKTVNIYDITLVGINYGRSRPVALVVNYALRPVTTRVTAPGSTRIVE
ncbi:MAG: carboxypeptidase regulatory-like domain-containing protein [Chloroflexi bacterium]|nr:carboxypeptidase regulatory-like domain-containing protein [Chloroflexota bacterium]